MSAFGISACVGILLGIGVIWWVAPATNSGTVLLFVVSFITVTVVCAVLGKIFGREK